MSATKDTLGDLHKIVAEFLTERLRSGEASGAELNAAIKFLKDNGIEAMVEHSTRLTDLANSLPDFDEPETDEVRYQ